MGDSDAWMSEDGGFVTGDEQPKLSGRDEDDGPPFRRGEGDLQLLEDRMRTGLTPPPGLLAGDSVDFLI